MFINFMIMIEGQIWKSCHMKEREKSNIGLNLKTLKTNRVRRNINFISRHFYNDV